MALQVARTVAQPHRLRRLSQISWILYEAARDFYVVKYSSICLGFATDASVLLKRDSKFKKKKKNTTVTTWIN